MVSIAKRKKAAFAAITDNHALAFGGGVHRGFCVCCIGFVPTIAIGFAG